MMCVSLLILAETPLGTMVSSIGPAVPHGYAMHKIQGTTALHLGPQCRFLTKKKLGSPYHSGDPYVTWSGTEKIKGNDGKLSLTSQNQLQGNAPDIPRDAKGM